jgi:Tol biopolymer transport system component
MKSLAPLLSIMALVFGLVGCPGGGGGGGSAADFAVSTTAADFGVVGNAYTSTLAVTGGSAPFTWTLFGGALPTGTPDLSLDLGTGVVSGTPTAAGNFTATFIVTDSTGKTATGSVLFAIHPRTDRVSVNGSGTAGIGASSAPSISGDGSLVAFASSSTNFVTDVNGTQIYLHNRQTNQIEVVSRDNDASAINEGGGASSDPSMSADGRFVAFVSQSTNLVTGVITAPQVYLRDRQTGQTTLISKSSSGATSNGGVNSSPAISSDGRYIAFVSVATNLGVAGGNQQIYLHDRVTGITSLISKDNNAVPGDGTSATPAINADGRYIAFASVSTNLGAAGGNQQIYIHDRLTGANGTTSLVSKDSVPTAGNGNSSAPSVSGDGRFVAFVSGATNIVTGFSGQQVYVHDRNTGANGTNSLISRDNSGVPNAGNQNSSAPSISSDGRYVAFTSPATNLIAGVSGQQIYLHDRNGPITSLVSRDNTGSLVEGNGLSDTPSINSDGGFVAFFSQATNLVAGSGAQIYVRALP